MKPLRKCKTCGKSKPAAKRIDGGYLCYKCYRKFKYEDSKKLCIICCEIKPIYKNGICVNCFDRDKKICKKCKELRLIHGNGLCAGCYSSPEKVCNNCEEVKIIHARGLCENCYRKERRKEPTIKIISRLRAQLNKCFRKYSSTGKIMKSKKYNINYEAIIKHLGPCPGDIKEYQIDHIFPLSAFDFNDPLHITVAFAPENHQWLRKEANLSKGSKYDQVKFEKYLTNGISS